ALLLAAPPAPAASPAGGQRRLAAPGGQGDCRGEGQRPDGAEWPSPVCGREGVRHGNSLEVARESFGIGHGRRPVAALCPAAGSPPVRRERNQALTSSPAP